MFSTTGIRENLIPANETRSATYRVPVPPAAGGTLEVDDALWCGTGGAHTAAVTSYSTRAATPGPS